MVKRNDIKEKSLNGTFPHPSGPNGVAIQANTEDPSSSQVSPMNAYPVHFFAAQTQHLDNSQNNNNTDLPDEPVHAKEGERSKMITTLTKYSLQSGALNLALNSHKNGSDG